MSKVPDFKRDIEDIKWALEIFAAEERLRNASVHRYSRGCGRSTDVQGSFEKILKRLEALKNNAKKRPKK